MSSNSNRDQQLKFSYQQKLPNQMVTALVVLDNKLTIKYVNPAAEALLVSLLNFLITAVLPWK
jgi:two-component system nitrogen regulation sensor histidine kinase GlnL